MKCKNFHQVLMSLTVLASWMRLKYPHIAIGALASSAPILQFEDIVPFETYYDIASNGFKVCSFFCLPRVCAGFGVTN